MSNFWRYVHSHRIISSSALLNSAQQGLRALSAIIQRHSGLLRKALLWIICTGYAFGALYSSISEAAEFQDLDLLKTKIIKDIRSGISPLEKDRYQIDVQNLDNRLRLADCNSGLATKRTRQSQLIGLQSVEVRCLGPKPWKIYLQVGVFVETEVPVLKHPVASGSVIHSSDIEMKSIRLGNNNQPIVEDVNVLLGKKAKRHLQSGAPILISQIEAANIIQRGQQVSLEYEVNGLTVRMSGKSSQNGAEGDWIKVVNPNSGKTIEGRVNASGNVSVHN